MHALRAAVEHLGRAFDAAEKLGQTPSKEVLRGRGQAYHDLGQFELARADYEAALESATMAGDKRMAWQLLVDLNLLWSARDYVVAGEYTNVNSGANVQQTRVRRFQDAMNTSEAGSSPGRYEFLERDAAIPTPPRLNLPGRRPP
jgi:tetratricopeptide (TPR) repeat protein